MLNNFSQTRIRPNKGCYRQNIRSPFFNTLLFLIALVVFNKNDRCGIHATPFHSSSGTSSLTNPLGTRVAYQGEPGAYSEKSTRELLSAKVITIGFPDFESCYRAVAGFECDYACLPIENSLGGSIHENYDLMLRYDLTIVAEHDFRVRHCFLVKKGVKRSDIKYAISHPQALAQCDGYLRSLGIKPVKTYDTAGSAKMIAEGSQLPEDCTAENTAAIASDLAGKTYGLDCLAEGIEDDDSNFTRFLLLARKGVTQYLKKGVPAKTSVVFTLPDTAGALYKALACFSLRDIDFSKIESRPTSASLLNFLKFKALQSGHTSTGTTGNANTLPRFRYCFYLDFLASELDEVAQHAMHHLREQADFCRVLGSFPSNSRLVGPVKTAVAELEKMTLSDETDLSQTKDEIGLMEGSKKLNVGIIGFGRIGQSLGTNMLKAKHTVSCMDTDDKSEEALRIGVDYYPQSSLKSFLQHLDVLIISTPLTTFQKTLSTIPPNLLANKLIVEMCPLSSHPKKLLVQALPSQSIDILSCLPLFSSSKDWDQIPLLYEKVRISDERRFQSFLNVFKRCKLLEMSAEQQDSCISDAAFIEKLTSRMLKHIPPTPVPSKEYESLLSLVEKDNKEEEDSLYDMYAFSSKSRKFLGRFRENLVKVERDLAKREAYLEASEEMVRDDRLNLMEECRGLLREMASDVVAKGGSDDNTVTNGKGGKVKNVAVAGVSKASK